MGVEAIVFLSPLENDNDKFSENVNVFIEDLTKYPGLTLNKYEGLNLDQLSKLITDFRIIERKDNVISGMPARIIIFSGRQGIYHIKQMQTYIIANNRAYVITFTAEETQYRNYEEVAKKIVNSILIKLNT